LGGAGAEFGGWLLIFMRTRSCIFSRWSLACLIMACCVGMAIGDEAPSQSSVASALLARYPQINSAMLGPHTNPDVNLKKWKFILYMTQFSAETGKSSQNCQVSADGRVSESWFDESGGKEGYRYSLSPTEFQRLTEAIASLPDRNDFPSLNRLVIVSYCKDTKYMTSTYDINHLPGPLKSLFHICGCGMGYDPNRFKWLSDSPSRESTNDGGKPPDRSVQPTTTP
jgi:hypothetical protein